MKCTGFLFGMCLVPMAALSAEPAMIGPLAGFILDAETRAVRPVLGIPGSAFVAGSVLQNVDALAVSPDGSVALAALSDRLALVERLPNGDFNAVRIEDSTGADRLAWSPDGSTAVAYSSVSRAAQILRQGKVSRIVELSALEGVNALAIDNSGDFLLAAGAKGIYLARKDGETSLIAAVPAAAAMIIRGADVFVAAGAVFEIKDYAGAAALLPFAGESGAVAIQAAGGGERLIVASANAVSIYDIASRTVASRLDLDFNPTVLSRLGPAAVFALNSGKAGVEPLYVVNVASAPAVYFVPSGREQ